MSETGTRRHGGFAAFARGRCENGGGNLYVNAKGEIERIHRTSIKDDPYVDIILPNSHGYVERGPTWIYKPPMPDGRRDGRPCGREMPARRELPNDSGWMSRVVDVDGDGYLDLIVVNGENGVTSELDSYVYWGGPDGLTGRRVELPTMGAYDVAAIDLTGDGRLDLIFPSAWCDHHNAGRPLPLRVYRQIRPRRFMDDSQHYGLIGVGAGSVACADLTGNGKADLVVANYRSGFEYDTESFVYWGTEGGFDVEAPLRLPSHHARQVLLADLDGDGRDEIVFAGGDQVWIYWNDHGTFSPQRRTILAADGCTTLLCAGAVRVEAADVDGDGRNELLVATVEGVEIRSSRDVQTVSKLLSLPNATWVCAADLDGDGRPELIASKYEDRVSYDTQSAIFWNGPKGFSERVTWLDTAGAMGCTAGDVDADGRNEVIFNNTMRGPSQQWDDLPAYIYLGSPNADYGLHRRLELPTGGGTHGYVLADLDLDGYADLVLTRNEGLRIFPGGPDGVKPDRFIDLPTPGRYIMEVHVADFNRDGHLDLLATALTYDDKPETFANSSIIFFGSAEGFSPERSQNVPTFSTGKAHVADVDKDGYLDIIIGDNRGFITIFHGSADGYSPDRVRRIPMDVNNVKSLNAADLNGNGWLDLVVGIGSHYERGRQSVYVYNGGPDGYRPDKVQKYIGGYSPSGISVADIDHDGKLELLVSAYSTAHARVLPLQIFRTDHETIEFDHPSDLDAESSCASMAIDLNGNGFRDLLVVCHRNDLGHQVDSLIFWNGPAGISPDRTTRLPGLGPHSLTCRDPGNAYTREPMESYFSPPFALADRMPTRIHWDAVVPESTQLKFQLRWAEREDRLDQAPWCGPGGVAGGTYERSGRPVGGIGPAARWLQYRAIFISPNSARSPRLREVRVHLGPRHT